MHRMPWAWIFRKGSFRIHVAIITLKMTPEEEGREGESRGVRQRRGMQRGDNIRVKAEWWWARTDSSYGRHNSRLGVPISHQISHLSHGVDDHADPANGETSLLDVGDATLPSSETRFPNPDESKVATGPPHCAAQPFLW